MKVPTYAVDHPYIKKTYPHIYQIFTGADGEAGSSLSTAPNGSSTLPSSTTPGYRKFLEARQRLKKTIDTT